MKKFFAGMICGLLFIADSAFAMTFSQPVKIGEIGFPVQAPYQGFIVEGATSNSGKLYREENTFRGKPVMTCKKGTAIFGSGEDALYCKYDFDAEISKAMSFGGKNNFVLTGNGSFKNLFKIDNDSKLALYAIYHNYCVSHLNIIGKQKDGKWVVFLDSKKISEKYFGGKDSYKEEGGVIYDIPTCAGDTIVVTYRRWHWEGKSEAEGELRFKWDESAQWFGVEQVIY